MGKIHQFVSSLAPRDGIGNIVLRIQKTLVDAGYESEVYSENIHPELTKKAQKFKKFNPEKSDLVLYHHGFESNLVEYFLKIPNKIVLIYHNITPPHFFSGYDELTKNGCVRGREQLELLKNRVVASFAFSNFSADELKELGFKNVTVLPPIIEFNQNQTKKYSKIIDNNHVKILHVGRVVPHKKIEDVLKSFACYNQCINDNSKLYIIGKYNNSDPYYKFLLYVIDKLEIKNIEFLDNVSDDELKNYYQNSDVYLSMTEHEGLGIPLIESMCNQVPTIAYAAAATPETMGGAGVLINEKNYEEIAEIIHMVVTNKNIKKNILMKQNHRVNELHNQEVLPKFLEQIKNFNN